MARVMAHEEITVDNGVMRLSAAVYNPQEGPSAVYAIIHAEGGAMRYFVNGQDPDSESGILLEDGDIVELPSICYIGDFRVVKAGEDPGRLTVTYEV